MDKSRATPSTDRDNISSPRTTIPAIAIVLYNIDIISYPFLQEQLQRLQHLPIVQIDNIDEWVDMTIADKSEINVVFIIPSNVFNTVKVLHARLPQIKRIYSFRDRNEISIHDGHGRAYLRNAQIDISTLADDILEWMKRNTQKIVEPKSSQSLSSEPFIFSWYQFFFGLLRHLQRTETAKGELIYAMHNDVPDDDKRNQCILEQFEYNYTSENAILWYTKDTFIYRRINQRLRSRNINAIFEYRVLILDIQNQLQNLHIGELDIASSELIEVYRGQPMSIDEIQYIKANLGGIIAINPFLSTTPSLEIAYLYAGDLLFDSELRSVICTIRIPLYVRGAIYASIEEWSAFKKEKETLICWRSLFRVDSVERGKSGRYMIQLTLIDEDDPQYREQQKVWKTSLGDRSFFDGRSTQLFIRDLNELNGPFLSFQVLMDIVLRLQETRFAKEEMVEFCRIKYTASNIILGQIDIFKDTYESNDAARWYTKDSFLYQLLNQTLRLEKIDLIFKLRLFIRDLHNQLHDLQDEFIRNESARNPRLTLYRGVVMPMTELERFHIGNRMSINSFLSTTTDPDQANDFACNFDDIIQDPDVSVIYEITVDLTITHTTPFASISHLSVNPSEREVLFSMAAVFCIDDIQQLKERLWNVKLTLINPEDESWNALTAHLK